MKKNNIRRMLNDRTASAYWFIYALAFLFVITILFIVFNQTLRVYLYPTTIMLTEGDTAKPDKWLSFWEFTPYIIVLIVVMFIFFKLTQRESIGE